MKDIIIRYNNNQIYLKNVIFSIFNNNIKINIYCNNNFFLYQFKQFYDYLMYNIHFNKIEIIKYDKIIICENSIIENFTTHSEDNSYNFEIELNIISYNIKISDDDTIIRTLKLKKIMSRIKNE